MPIEIGQNFFSVHTLTPFKKARESLGFVIAGYDGEAYRLCRKHPDLLIFLKTIRENQIGLPYLAKVHSAIGADGENKYEDHLPTWDEWQNESAALQARIAERATRVVVADAFNVKTPLRGMKPEDVIYG